MKIIELQQGSDAWKKWRQTKITGTAASVIMGNNPWKTRLDLWNELLGITPPQEMNEKMQRGNNLEPKARMIFEEIMGMEFPPIVCESDEYDFMGASLDGWNEDNKAVLEIKCPSERTHKEAIDGIVPQYYIDQCQHALIVTGGVICYYVSYRPEHDKQIAVVEIKPKPEYMIQIIEKEKDFYENNLFSTIPTPPETWEFKCK